MHDSQESPEDARPARGSAALDPAALDASALASGDGAGRPADDTLTPPAAAALSPDGAALPTAILPATGTPRLGVVLVNWNGAEVSIECLETLLRSDLALRVVVVDNGSVDGSVERLKAWAEGLADAAYTPPDNPLGRLSSPPLAKPLPYLLLGADEVADARPGDARFVIIDAAANLGFAGGNNLGMRYLLRDPVIDAIWLLNNDTVVEPTAARAVLDTLRSDRRMGMAGTLVRYYNDPDIVQVKNGMTFNLLTGMSRPIGGGQPVSRKANPADIIRRTDFVLGASLAVTRRFVEEVGLMSERYFLYYEEIDWATRNRGRFRLGYARGASVFHKHGGAIGSSSVKGGRSAMSDYWMLRSRLKFYRTHYPALLPLLWVQGVAQTGIRLLRRQPGKAAAMTKALFGRPL